MRKFSPIFSKYFYGTLDHILDEIINMNDEAKVEIKFWLHNCQSLPQKRFCAKNVLPDKIVYTDASSFEIPYSSKISLIKIIPLFINLTFI
jgi:hypothetical protein